MIPSVSNGGIELYLGCGSDSVTLTAKDLVQEMTISSQEIPLAVCSLLLSHRKDFPKSHLARDSNTPNHEGIEEMRDEVQSSLGAQDMDTSAYQVSDLDVVKLYWDKDQLDADAVFRPGIDTLFSLLTFNDFEMG